MEIIQKYDKDKQSSLWYGGAVAKMKYKGYDFYVMASGDVRAYLLDDNNEEIVYVKDKSNSGKFYDEMRHYIKNDTELYDLEENGKLIFDNNNWWEVYVEKDKQEVFSDVLDSYLIEDAMDEVIVNKEQIIEFIEEE